MLRTRLLTAVAVAGLMAATVAVAQEPAAQTPPTLPTEPTTSAPANDSDQAPATQAPATATAPAATSATTGARAGSVVDVLKAQGNYATLLRALDQAQLTETLASRPAITIFAPTDEAFAALPEADRTRLLDPANAQELRSLLLYHVIVADVTADQIQGSAGPVETAGGVKVQIDGSGEAIKVDGATVASANLDASNGGVFPINQVLNPAQSQAAMGDEDSADAAAPAAPAANSTPATAAPATPAAPTTPATPAEETDDSEATTPAASATPSAAPAARTAPNGQPAASTTMTTNPPVQNPTDGQVDEDEDTANPAPTPN